MIRHARRVHRRGRRLKRHGAEEEGVRRCGARRQGQGVRQRETRGLSGHREVLARTPSVGVAILQLDGVLAVGQTDHGGRSRGGIDGPHHVGCVQDAPKVAAPAHACKEAVGSVPCGARERPCLGSAMDQAGRTVRPKAWPLERQHDTPLTPALRSHVVQGSVRCHYQRVGHAGRHRRWGWRR